MTLEISGFEYPDVPGFGCVVCGDPELACFPLNGIYTMVFQEMEPVGGIACIICTDADVKTHQCTPNDPQDGYFFNVYLYCVNGHPVELGISAGIFAPVDCTEVGHQWMTNDPAVIADFLACLEVTGNFQLECLCPVFNTIGFALQLQGCS